jgi:hypothetical protein
MRLMGFAAHRAPFLYAGRPDTTPGESEIFIPLPPASYPVDDGACTVRWLKETLYNPKSGNGGNRNGATDSASD